VEESCEKLTATAERQKSILLELVPGTTCGKAMGKRCEKHGKPGKPWENIGKT